MTISFLLGVDSSDAISVMPMFDYDHSGEKIESVHRTLSGGQYRYKWGAYDKISFSVNYVNSADACMINSWWGGNVDLHWIEINSAGSISRVSSVHIVNGDKPLSKKQKPYWEYFKGKLDLETY